MKSNQKFTASTETDIKYDSKFGRRSLGLRNASGIVLLSFCCAFSNGAAAANEKIESVDKSTDKPISLGIETFLAKTLPAPTVIVLHGCGGITDHHKAWAQELQGWGFNAVVLDSFTNRDAKDVCKNLRLVSPTQRAMDAHYAAEWIAKQSWASPKIGVLGFSHGSWTALKITAKNERATEFPSGSKITAAVSYYPYCDKASIADSAAIPIQIHHGSLDDWNPIGPCKELAQSWVLGDNFYVYEGSHHAFDAANVFTTFKDGKGNSRTQKSDPEANALSRTRTLEFLNKNLK